MYRSMLVGAGLLMLASTAQAQDWRTITSQRQYRNEEDLRVQVQYGGGRLSIGPTPSGNALYRALLRYDANAFKPVTEYKHGQLVLGIDGGSIRGRNLKEGRLDITLSNKLPLELDLKFGAVEADIELGGLRVRELSISTGASETNIGIASPNSIECSQFKAEVGAAEFKIGGLGNLNCEKMHVQGGVGDVTLDFNGAWRIDALVEVEMGLGSLTLRVPRGLGVQVRKGGVLSSFDSQELIKRGNVYYSENWDEATNRLTFVVDAALGSIRMEWVEPTAEFRKAKR